MELPTITTSAYAGSVVEPAQWVAPAALGGKFDQQHVPKQLDPAAFLAKVQAAERRLTASPVGVRADYPLKVQPIMSTARIVKVFIADNNENLPLDKRVLYTGAEHLTDLTDQELFFEIAIAELLREHNRVRVTYRDKKAANTNGDPVLLEPARIRDLKMVVVTVASF
jgi:hypothetical protein